MSIWNSVYRSGTRFSGHRFRPGHEALDVAPEYWGDNAILGQLDGVVEDYGADSIITNPGSGSRGIWVRIRHDDGTSVEHCHLAGVPWPVDDRYSPDHVKGNPIGQPVVRGEPTGFFTGLTGDTNGYHDHLIARDANGVRVDPEPLLFGETPEPPQEDEMTEEQKRLHDIGVRAEEHKEGEVGNLQNAIHATDGWGNRLIKPGIPKRAEEREAGRQLLDAAKSMRYVLTGVQE